MNNGKKITSGKPSDRNLTIYERAVLSREPYADIAEDHGLSIGRISQIVREVSTALVPEHLDRINEMRVEHTAALGGVLTETMEAWRASKKSDAEPDPRFLEVARKCLADQRKIWGAEAEIIQKAPVVPEEKAPPAIVMVMIESFDEFQEYERMLEFKDVKELVLDVFEASDVFGEVGVLDFGPRPFDAIAETRTELFRMERWSVADSMYEAVFSHLLPIIPVTLLV